MDSAAIECLHGALSGTGIVILDEPIVVTLGLGPNVSADRLRRGEARCIAETHILVGDDLDVLDMASRLKNLAQDILGDTRV